MFLKWPSWSPHPPAERELSWDKPVLKVLLSWKWAQLSLHCYQRGQCYQPMTGKIYHTRRHYSTLKCLNMALLWFLVTKYCCCLWEGSICDQMTKSGKVKFQPKIQTASVIFTYGWQHWSRIFHTMILWFTAARSTKFCREIWGKKEENLDDSGRFFQAVTVWLEITKLGITQLVVHNTLLGLMTPPASLPADVTSHYGNSLVRTSQTFLSITHY